MPYLALDVGNVLCNVNFSELIKILWRDHNIDADDAAIFLSRIQPFQDLGHTSMLNEFNYHFRIRPENSVDLMRAWYESITPHEPSVRWLRKFLEQGVEIAILSNIGLEHYSNLPRLIPEIMKCLHFMSCDVGARKPNILYYKTFLDLHPEFKNAIYIDDRPENLNAGNLAGLDARCLDTALMTPDAVEHVWQKIEEDLKLPLYSTV